jgi:transcriptional regulator with XRE-family HTH domain
VELKDNIRRYRLETGISLEALAKKCNVSYPTMQQVATGRRKASVMVESKIRKVVG